jgi:hypothetical protein
MFLANLWRGDSVIAAMAREFLQMGFMRARRAVRQLQRQPEIRPGRALPGCLRVTKAVNKTALFFTPSKLHGEGRVRDFIFRMGYGILWHRPWPIEASEGFRTELRNFAVFHRRKREPYASRFMSLRSSPPRNQSKASDFDRVQLLYLRTTCGTMGLLFSEIRPSSLQSGSPSSVRLQERNIRIQPLQNMRMCYALSSYQY